MEKEDNIHYTALKLAEEIKNLSIYKSFYSDVQASIIPCISMTLMSIYFLTLHNK